ncbi:protein O-mannosyl-transferase family [Chryseobacterium sp. MYb328]|uniref:protein O-mannosyl-transferase family n=1 Tax=Chryseobacterium sp. MYb328 TaxID=2745231 RepID=UPI0030A11009
MKQYLSAAALFFIFLAIYYIGSFTKIPFADCVGFVLSVEKGEFETAATATSHFLYTNTAIFIKNLTGLHPIEASRLLVVASGAFTVSIIYLIVKTITKTQWTAITAAFVFGFSFSFWRNAEIVEVYTYNSLWVSLFFLSMVKVFIEKKNIHIILSSLFLGIALWVHIQNILLIPALLLFLFYFRQEKRYASFSVILFALLFSSLFILNMSQGLPFKAFYSSDQGTWVEDSLKQTPVQLVKDFFQSFIYLIYNFNIFIFFGIAGMGLLYKANRQMFTVFFVAALLVYGFATFYLVSDNYVFFLPFNIIFALSIGYGLSSVKYVSFKKFSWVCLLIPLGYISAYNVVLLTEKGREADAFKKYKGGMNYYLLPWMNDNVGILEFTVDNKVAPEPINWMTVSAKEYIKVLKNKGYTEEEIRKL